VGDVQRYRVGAHGGGCTRWDGAADGDVVFYADHAAALAAVEAERARLRESLDAIRADWIHNAPGDCYATGPLTGNAYTDLVRCPGCAIQATLDAALSAAPGGERAAQ
jgi:hypothetical protein